MGSPACTVIICHHRGTELIQRCLESVFASQGIHFRVIVVTSDPTFMDRRVTQFFTEDGPAHKRNVGMAHSRSPYAVFLDDDVEISPYCLYELWKFLEEHPKCGMAFAKIYKMEEGRRDEFDACGSWLTWTGFLWDRASNYLRDIGQFGTSQPCLASKSATCAIRRSTFQSVGGFDRDYYILGEETDLAWRLWLRGWECWYVPSAVSWHAFGCESLKPRADLYTIRRTMTYGCRNYLSLLWTNVGTAKRMAIIPIQMLAWNLAAMGFFLRGDGQRGLAIMRGMYQFVQRLPDLQRKRHRVQSTRIVSDRALWPTISRSPGVKYYLSRMWRYWTTQLHG